MGVNWQISHPASYSHVASAIRHLGSDRAELLDELDLQGWPYSEDFKKGSGISEKHLKILAKVKSSAIY